MKSADVTVEVLKSIRDEIKGLRGDTEGLRSEVRQTNERLDRLDLRQTNSETRLATEIVAVVQAVNQVRDLLGDRLQLRDRVEDHEQRLRTIEQRTGP